MRCSGCSFGAMIRGNFERETARRSTAEPKLCQSPEPHATLSASSPCVAIFDIFANFALVRRIPS
jgi:hypothetical protein